MSEDFEYRAIFDYTDVLRKWCEHVQYHIDEAAVKQVEDRLAEFGYIKVIRCRDCEHFRADLMYGDDNAWCGESAVFGRLTPPDGYCHRAVRREDA